ncbi:CshA/CshB family fibrillar adhesin-related protein [Mariniflexile ostreae]|uniref:CshA/CshB family fibrillar adhesin-related protein n=1 Tax=Mariniflexile ostreae TaxID=1520892 RepID=A0ABV5FBG6_9FLAO
MNAQCYPDKIVTAAFATDGLSPYKDNVLWLTWGSPDQQTYPYGRHDRPLSVGATSYASIDLGDDRFLCIKAEIESIDGAVSSYAPGNWQGDYLDDLYHIGGTGSSNQLVSGIKNRTSSSSPKITIKCLATLDGSPIRLSGLVVADAESLNRSGEYISTTADGNWTLVEVKKNIGQQSYDVRKEIVFENGSPTSKRTIKFLRGNDNNTMAVSFLKFNESAYHVIGPNPDFSVQVKVDFHGGGITAIALGLLPPDVDGGDAPISYGKPLHLIQRLNFTNDGIVPVNEGANSVTNINTSSYKAGALVDNGNISHLGSTAPDTETISIHSKDALGDDHNGSAGPKEEDAWPKEYKRFSFKVNYLPGNIIAANIPYKSYTDGYVVGWIDFNGNGVFDSSEKQEMFAPSTGGTMESVLLKWEIPGTRKPYSTFVRLRLSELPNVSPDEMVNTGEVEDHKIFILGPVVTNPMIHSKGKAHN